MVTVKPLDTKLATDYETLRRREYELISGLLEVLPRVDNLPEGQVAQMRDALFHADHPYMVVFVGPFSSGKSSLINALMGKANLMPVGVTPTTDHISILRYGDEPETMPSGSGVDAVFYPSKLLEKVCFVDTPGLESVFTEHEETTRNFLHRSDVVFLVMLATQAMTARNLEYLHKIKGYGTKVIVLINQVDLLTDEELQSVLEYVKAEGKARLGTEPDIWPVSARKGLQAQQAQPLDEALWQESGLHRIVNYVEQQLSDVDRMRQKLRTPLQITQNVNQTALAIVRENQSALDHYQNIADNIDQQLNAQRRDQGRVVQQITEEISNRFGKASMNGSEAIRDVFGFSRALGTLGRGAVELVGLGGFLRQASPGSSFTRRIFEQHQAFAPLNDLGEIANRLGPRLEGQDVQDIDDLVKYAQREIKALPEAIQEKVIGEVRAPLQYDRRSFDAVASTLEEIENEARVLETEKLDRTVRNTTLYLVIYEIMVLLVGLLLSQTVVSQPEYLILLVFMMLGLALLGLALLPVRGRFVENTYTTRMQALQQRYNNTLTEAANRQIDYSMQLRRDAIAPLTRLVESQTEVQKDQLHRLLEAEQALASIESSLTSLGKRSLLGG